MGVLTRSKAGEQALALTLFANELPDPECSLFFEPLPNFHLFSKLPPELRIVVWSFTFPKGRLYFDNYGRNNQFRRKNDLVSASIVCKESRKEFLNHYMKLSTWDDRWKSQYEPEKPRYWNPEVEPIRVSIEWNMDYNWQKMFTTPYAELLSSIQIVELETSCWCPATMDNLAEALYSEFHRLTNLKELRIINVGPRVNLWDSIYSKHRRTRAEWCLAFLLDYFVDSEWEHFPEISIITNRTNKVNLWNQSFSIEDAESTGVGSTDEEPMEDDLVGELSEDVNLLVMVEDLA